MKKFLMSTEIRIFLVALALGLFPFVSSANDFFNKLYFSTAISKQQIQKAIQAMATNTYLVGFRTLGSSEDAFHAHLIYDGTNPVPKLLLFHTQERANLYALYEPKSRYNYTDRTKRNWIVWLDTMIVEDANKYRYSYTKPDWCSSEEAYTINSDMLDPQKLHFTGNVVETAQINFYQTRCGKNADQDDTKEMSITMPDGSKPVCLELYSEVPQDKYYSINFFTYGSRMAQDVQDGKIKSACPQSTITNDEGRQSH